MDDGGKDQKTPPPASRSVIAALIVISRFLDHASPSFAVYLSDSIDHAIKSGVAADDLAVVKTLLTAIKGDSPAC